MPVSRQAYREFGEFPDFAVHADRAAVLLRYNVVADRQTEAGSFASRLGRKERLEQLVLDLRRDAGAVIAHPDLYRLAELARHHLHRGAKAVRGLVTPLGRGIKAVAEQVQEHAGHVLWYQLDRCDAVIQLTLQGDVEVLVL